MEICSEVAKREIKAINLLEGPEVAHLAGWLAGWLARSLFVHEFLIRSIAPVTGGSISQVALPERKRRPGARRRAEPSRAR